MANRKAAAKKAAKTKQQKAAAKKASKTTQHRAPAKKAAKPRKLSATGQKAAQTKKRKVAGKCSRLPHPLFRQQRVSSQIPRPSLAANLRGHDRAHSSVSRKTDTHVGALCSGSIRGSFRRAWQLMGWLLDVARHTSCIVTTWCDAEECKPTRPVFQPLTFLRGHRVKRDGSLFNLLASAFRTTDFTLVVLPKGEN